MEPVQRSDRDWNDHGMMLFYDRAEVALRDGRVTDHNLMIDMALADKLRRGSRKKALLARLAEENRMQRESEGLALKQSKLDDP